LATLTANGFAPVALETGQQIQLAMQRLWLEGELLPAGGRLRIAHIFRSAETRPLEVIYCFMLPRDAALRRFRVVGEGFSVRSELRKVEEARRAYEEAIGKGHLATLAEQYGDGLVNLTVGNIRPEEQVTVYLEILAGVEQHDHGFRFRFPFTVAPAYHSRMRVAAPAAGRGEIELPEEEFGDLILPVWQENASALHQVGFELAVSLPAPIRQIASPSHQIQIAQEDPQRYRVLLAPEADLPDRDLILEVRSKEALEGALTGVDKKGNGRFVAFIPSRRIGEVKDGPRRVVFVIDRSGSMSGIVIEQARRSLLACLGALREADQFGIVAFDDRVEHFRDQLVPATRDNRDEAKRFLEGVDARAGTHLAAGIEAGVKLLGGAAGDLLVITDGQVFGTEQVIARARATQTRVHCLGIGAASQARFLAMLARETGATSRFLSFNERVDVEALALFAGIGRPAAEELTVKVQAAGGAVAPEPPRHVFPGTPLVVHGSTAGPGEAALEIRWKGANGREQLDLPFHIAESRFGEVLRLLTGARLLTDLENRLGEVDQSPAATAVERRTQRRISEQLEALGSEYGLASRAMALVAVVERPGDVTGRLPETRVVPVGLPQGVEFAAYFPGILFAAPRLRAHARACSLPWPEKHTGRLVCPPPRPRRTIASQAPMASAADELLELLGRLEPDGGLPGWTTERRILASLFLVLRLVEEGGAPETSPYRIHIERLTEFVRTRMDALATHHRRLVEAALEVVETGGRLEGEWKLSENFSTPKAWSRLSEALKKAGR
jgi:Ca-activated chloride channel family protein